MWLGACACKHHHVCLGGSSRGTPAQLPRHLRSRERARPTGAPPPPTSLPVKRHGLRVGTASSSYVPESPLKCFWARSSSCRCSSPAEMDSVLTGQPGPTRHTEAQDPVSCLDGRTPKTGHQDQVREEEPPQTHSSSAAGRADPQGPTAPTTSATRKQQTSARLKDGPSRDALSPAPHTHTHTRLVPLGMRPPVLPRPSSPSSSRFCRAGERAQRSATQGCDKLWGPLCQGHGAAMSQTHVSCPCRTSSPPAASAAPAPRPVGAVVQSGAPRYRPPGASAFYSFLP